MTWFDYIVLLAASAPAVSLQESHLVSLRVRRQVAVDGSPHYITRLFSTHMHCQTDRRETQKMILSLRPIPALVMCDGQTEARQCFYKKQKLCLQELFSPSDQMVCQWFTVHRGMDLWLAATFWHDHILHTQEHKQRVIMDAPLTGFNSLKYQL